MAASEWWAGRRARAEDRSVGAGMATGVEIFVIAFVAIAVFVLLVGALLAFWPPPAPNAGVSAPTSSTVVLFRWSWSAVSRDGSLFVIAMSAGALGGLLHTARSLYWYVGNRNLRRSWVLMYAFLPITGAVISLITYLLLRAGLTTTQSSDAISAYGIAATGALAGLFSREAMDKLRLVFETLLTPAEKGKDQTGPFEITGIKPESGKVGDSLVITGRGLVDVAQVEFDGVGRVKPELVTDTEVRIKVPMGASSGPIKLYTPSGESIRTPSFTVET
ncbi:MAG: IPT/TIG domain-containing protein [Candidatus Saccharimonadales bacterium]